MKKEFGEHMTDSSAGEYCEDILQGLPVAAIIIDAAGLITMANNAAMVLLGYSGEELLGRHAETICSEAGNGILTASAGREGEEKQTALYRETLFRTKAGRSIPVEYACSSLSRNGDSQVICIASDLIARKKVERRRAAQHAVVHVLSEFRDMNDTLMDILKVICESIDWMLGEIWLVDPDNAKLSLSLFWNAPRINAAEFEALSRQFVFTKGKGLPGRVWESGKPAWIADVTQDPNFCRHDAALTIGLHGAFAFPIRLLDDITGIMVFFSDSPQEPDDDLLEMFDALGLQIGDFIERKSMEEEVRRVLREKEVLLREIHHRVTSNLQVIISMIRLQARLVLDESALRILKDMENRIRSMGLIHEKLYHEKDLQSIKFEDYIRSVVRELSLAYGAAEQGIAIKIEADSFYLAIDKAIPCGLIVNELVSNALKHAFPEGRKGEVRVILKKNEKGHELTVMDDGIGMREEVAPSEATRFGMQLIDTLVRQMDGVLEVKRNNGTEFHIWC